MFKVVGMHTMDACSHIFFSNQILVYHVLNQNRGGDTSVSIIWDIAILRAYKEFIPILSILSCKCLKGCTYSPLCFLASIVYCCIKNVDATTKYHQLDSIVHIKICLVIRGSYICPKANSRQFKRNMEGFSKMSGWHYTFKLKE